MNLEYHGPFKQYLQLSTFQDLSKVLERPDVPELLTIIWNTEGTSILRIDGAEQQLQSNELLFITEFHKVEFLQRAEGRVVRFNRAFYCIADHDDEVSCKGFLFYGASQVPVIHLTDKHLEQFEILWRMFSIEMEVKDNIQFDMLQMMLKRLIILCTRLAKDQIVRGTVMDTNQTNLLREFNFLVEKNYQKNYQQKHTVAQYAELMNKSPKTLSNLFALHGYKTPLQVIQDRIMLEARRLLIYTDLSIKEISYQLGFEDIQTFSIIT